MAVLYRDAPPRAAGDAYVVARAPHHDRLLAGEPRDWEAARTIEWGPPRWLTRLRAVSTPLGLVARFDCRDEAPWYTMTHRDAPLWQEEVVEIFIDPACHGRDYVELEINPANVVCDLKIREPWPGLSGDLEWNLDGLETRVLPWRDPEAGPAGWSAVAFMPWEGILSVSCGTGVTAPPAPGDRWNFNAFRIKRPGGPHSPDDQAVYAAWSVPDGPSFHVPDAFRAMIFS